MDAAYAETIIFRFIGYNLLGSAVRDASGMLGGLANVAENSSNSIARSFGQAGSAVAGIGTAMMLAGVLLAGSIAYATSKASEFNSQMILLHTQARVSTDQLQTLGAGVLSMSGQVGFSSTKLAEALYFIESVGGGSYTTAHALDELRAAAMGAAVGHADLAVTASNLASVMAVFPGMLPIQAMGQLDAIIGQGKMTMDDLNGALKTGILATLQASGVSLADFGGALATMTDYAIPATQAANSLRMAIYLMSAPTAASNKVLKELGLTTAEISSVSQEWTNKLEAAGIRHAQLADDLRKPGGIILALQDLRSHMQAAGLSAEGQAEVIYKAFGGGKMGKAVITLYENIAGGARASDAELIKLGFTTTEIATLHDRLIQKTALINAQTNLLGQNFKYIQENDPVQMFHQLTSGVNALVIAIGEAFIPVLIGIIHWLTPIVSAITDFVTHNQELVRTIGIGAVIFLMLGGAAMVLVGLLGILAGAIIAIISVGSMSLFIPITLGLLALGAVVAGVAMLIVTHWGQTQAVFKQVATFLKPVFDEIGNTINFLKPIVIAAFNAIIEAVKPVIAYILPQLAAAWARLSPILLPLMKNLYDIAKPFLVVAAIILGAFLSGAGKALLGFLMGAIPTAVNFVVDVITLLGTVFQFIADIFRNVANIVTDLIHGQWMKAWNDFVKLLSDAGVDILNILGQLVITVVHLIEGLVVTIGATLWGFVSGVVGFFQWLYNQLVGHSIIPDMINSIIDYFASLPRRILGALGSLANLLFQTGRDIVQGLMNGIDSMWNGLVSHFKNLVSQLPDGVKKFLGISSPSLVFAEQVGVPIMQGIAMGITGEAPATQAAMSNAVSGLLVTPTVGTPTFGAIPHSQILLTELIAELKGFHKDNTADSRVSDSRRQVSLDKLISEVKSLHKDNSSENDITQKVIERTAQIIANAVTQGESVLANQLLGALKAT